MSEMSAKMAGIITKNTILQMTTKTLDIIYISALLSYLTLSYIVFVRYLF